MAGELTTILAPGTRVTVRCHPGCPWMEGYVVVGAEPPDRPVGYWVRREGLDRPLGIPMPPEHLRVA